MVEGKLRIGLTEKDIKDILPKGEFTYPGDGIVALNQWIVPHWDWVKCIKVGAIKMNSKTVEFIIGRIKELFPDQGQEVMMVWLDYGCSVNNDLPDWVCELNFYKVEYKEI